MNFKMTDIQGAIGRAQLKKLPSFIRKRDEIYSIYESAGLPLLGANSDLSKNIYPVRYRAVVYSDRAKDCIQMLKKNGVSSIVPIAEWELLAAGSDFKNATYLARNTFSLPIYPDLQLETAKTISNLVMDFL